MGVQFIKEGKFRIQTVGAPKSGVSKAGKQWKTYDVQFENDVQWYSMFWSETDPPAIGQEFEGKKEYNDQFNTYQFNRKFAGNKANWNPAAANATVMGAAIALVNGFLGLSPKYFEEWEKKRRDKQTPVDHYMETVLAMAQSLKQEVVKMGGNETMTATEASKAPVDDGDPGPQHPGVDGSGEEDIDLGPL